eukprot:894486_1
MGAAACGHVFDHQQDNEIQSQQFNKWLELSQKDEWNSLKRRVKARNQFGVWLRACFFVTVVDVRVPDFNTHFIQYLHWATGPDSEWISDRNIKTLITLIPDHIKNGGWYLDQHYMHELKSYCIIVDVGLCASLIPHMHVCPYCESASLRMHEPTKLIYVHNNELLPGSAYRIKCNSCKRYFRYGSHVSKGVWIPDENRNELKHWMASSDTAMSTDTLVESCGNSFIFKAGSATEERRRVCKIFSKKEHVRGKDTKSLRACIEEMLKNAKYYKDDVSFAFHEKFDKLDEAIENNWYANASDQKRDDTHEPKTSKYARHKQSFQQMLIGRKWLERRLIQKAKLGYMWHIMTKDLCARTNTKVLDMLSVDLDGKRYPTVELIISS